MRALTRAREAGSAALSASRSMMAQFLVILSLLGAEVLNLASAARQRHRTLRNDTKAVMQEVRMIGGGLILILIITLVLTEVYNAINVTESSPFYSVVTSLEGTGVAALTLMVVGLLVIAASAIMRYFGGGFGGR